MTGIGKLTGSGASASAKTLSSQHGAFRRLRVETQPGTDSGWVA
jgi:hypothetical protein